MTILVTGARGHVGAAVLMDLVEAGEAVRASSRDPKPSDFPPGIEVVRADLTEPESFPELLSGVHKVFLYANAQHATEFAEAARHAGVEHIVLLSSSTVLFADAEANPIARQHLIVEQALRESGVDWTFVRPAYFATNMLRWQSIRTERVLRTAFPDGTTPAVHERDIADVAALALKNDAHRGAAYAVLGDAVLSVREQVAVIAEAVGEPVRLEQVDVEAFRGELLTQLPEAVADLMITVRGHVAQVPPEVAVDAVHELLGRQALTLSQWANDHADDFR